MKIKGLYYKFRFQLRKRCGGLWKLFHLKYTKREFIENQDRIGDEIKEAIKLGKPFMAARIGATESLNLRTYEFEGSDKRKKAIAQLCLWSGFFPEKEELGEQFCNIMKDSLSEADICGVLRNEAEEYFIDTYTRADCKVTILWFLECFQSDSPWSALLKGKKVLVVHPFSKTIQKQYAKRELLFPGRDVLPEFELITYKAVQTIAGEKDERFETWFEALDFMTEEISHIDFDIALLGCGAYGFPLAANIKRMGKQAIQIGGGLQLYFGIKGKRWDEMPEFAQMYNDAWVYPDASETPKAAGKVENSCYWG